MHGPQSHLTATYRGNAADWKYLMTPVGLFYRDERKGRKQDSKLSIAAKYILMMHCEA